MITWRFLNLAHFLPSHGCSSCSLIQIRVDMSSVTLKATCLIILCHSSPLFASPQSAKYFMSRCKSKQMITGHKLYAYSVKNDGCLLLCTWMYSSSNDGHLNRFYKTTLINSEIACDSNNKTCNFGQCEFKSASGPFRGASNVQCKIKIIDGRIWHFDSNKSKAQKYMAGDAYVIVNEKEQTWIQANVIEPVFDAEFLVTGSESPFEEVKVLNLTIMDYNGNETAPLLLGILVINLDDLIRSNNSNKEIKYPVINDESYLRVKVICSEKKMQNHRHN